MRPALLFISLLFFFRVAGQNVPPRIDDLLCGLLTANENTVFVAYSVFDPEGDSLEVTLQISTDGGKTYAAPGPEFVVSGAVGYPIFSGQDKQIVCSYIAPGLSPPLRFRLVVDDKKAFDLGLLATEADSNRMRGNLEFLEGIRHYAASVQQLNDARDSLRNLFDGLGLRRYSQSFNFAGTVGENIIGDLPGVAAAEQVVIIDAHYDTVNNSPGADDNGSGVAGVMEAARILSRYPFQKTMRFIGFDFEESGLVGSTRYVNQGGIQSGESILGVFNFEMIGYYSEAPNSQSLPGGFSLLFPDAYNQVAANQFRGDFLTNVGNVNATSLANLLSASAAQYVPDLKVITVLAPGNSAIAPDLRRSDHAPFWDAGYKALMLTDGANFRNPHYHTPSDLIDNTIDFGFMRRVVQATVVAAAQLGGIVHGDWATCGDIILGSTATGNPSDPCQPEWRYGLDGGLWITAPCIASAGMVEIFDLQGRSLALHTLPPRPESHRLGMERLRPGAYMARLSWPGGVRAFRFVQAR
ncbi:MAG: M28 family peptidase [Saprospiraceae bacterium]